MDCLSCGHPEEEHCKGNVYHPSWKPNHHGTVCICRHCDNPLCSCVGLQLPKPVKKVDPILDRALKMSPFRK